MKHIFSYFTIGLMAIAMLISCKKDEDCPTGYTGSDCDEQVTPSRMTITGVRATKFPALNTGASWDEASGPDIYFQVYTQANGIIYDSPTYFEDADSSQDYDFDIDTPIQIANPTGIYGIQLLDYDELIDEDDFMGGLTFIPYASNTNGFPQTLTLEGDLVSFVLTVTYEY